MMLALLTSLFAKLVGAFPVGLPESVKKALAWATLAIAALGILWGAKAAYDASVIRDSDRDRRAESIDALDQAAEQRANDAIINMINEKEREDAIQAAPTGSTLSGPELALQCERLRKLGRNPPACVGHQGGD